MEQTRTQANSPPQETLQTSTGGSNAGTRTTEVVAAVTSRRSSHAIVQGAKSEKDHEIREEAKVKEEGLDGEDLKQTKIDGNEDVEGDIEMEDVSMANQSIIGERRPSSFNIAMCHNNNTIFKPFDSQTGQFMAPSSSSTKVGESQEFMDEQRNESSPPATANVSSTSASTSASSSSASSSSCQKLISSTILEKGTGDKSEARGMKDHNPVSSTNNLSVMGKSDSRTEGNNSVSRFHNSKKIRSHSVPTILHSSLRKMANTVQVQKDIIIANNGMLPPADLSLKHSNCSSTALQNSCGVVKKKRSLKKEHLSLRNALLLTHRLQSSNDREISLDERISYIQTYPTPVPLPPINLQCLKEIDLSEIVKNPQLRHDIVFDPMLQFRPNFDGERGVKKRQIADSYWSDIENEIFVYNQQPDIFDRTTSRLIPLFDTLKDVLVTIVPQKEASSVSSVLDTDLLIQELLKGSLVMSNFSDWLAQLFKHHCAPMRDPWVDRMASKFKEAEEKKSIPKLVEALRLVFQILEVMKLDIANHQIRILRPALLSNTVDFEKQYFQSLMSSDKVDLTSSLKWFSEKYREACSHGTIDPNNPTPIPQLYRLCIKSVISLLSCRKMVKDYPTALSFDHARLILLRADVRQIVCLMVCKLLFKQLVANNTALDRPTKEYIIKNYPTKRLKEEIVSIITDEHGNCRWTKNTLSIAVQLNKVINQLKTEYLQLNSNSSDLDSPTDLATSAANLSLDSSKIEFANSWLSKQTQPLSDVYGVLENRVFKSLEDMVFKFGECSKDGTVRQDFINMCGNTTISNVQGNNSATIPEDTSSTMFSSPHSSAAKQLTSTREREIKESLMAIDMEEFENSYRHLYTVVSFHWSVFGCHYLEHMNDKVERV